MKKRELLLSILWAIKFVSAEVFGIEDITKYGYFFYISIGIAVLLVLIVLVLLFKKKKLKVRIKSGKVGEELDILVNPGKDGVSNKIMLFSGEMKIGELPLCSEQVCYDSRVLKYKIPESWKVGKYRLQVQDLKQGWKDFEFEIKA